MRVWLSWNGSWLACHMRMCAKLLKGEGTARGGRRGVRGGLPARVTGLPQVSNSKETENLLLKPGLQLIMTIHLPRWKGRPGFI